MVTRARDGIHKPKVPYIGLAECKPMSASDAVRFDKSREAVRFDKSSEAVCFKNSDADRFKEIEPHTPSEALSSSYWREAMDAEFRALQNNRTWVLVPPSKDQKVVDSKWVFKIKYNTNGSISKHKARLVAKGFQQVPGIDFGETFSPVIKATTVRIILTIAVTFSWPVRQLDVNNAFLNGLLKEDVFMKQPVGFQDPQRPQHVCKLVKALYGLKQAPRAWFERLRNTLIQWGFQNSKTDVSLFFLKTASLTVFVLIYVDDILVTGNNGDYLAAFTQKLNNMFSLKDLGSLSYFLGIEVCRDKSGIFLSQGKYISDVLQRFNMSGCASVSTPMVTGKKFTAKDGKLMDDPYVYRRAIGSLQYITTTRPDISFAVNKLSQFLAAPTDVHSAGVKRIMRYLKGTKQLGLHLKPVDSLKIVAFTDADWATDLDDWKSIGGMCTYLGNTLISWSSRKQKVVSRSSTESEYRALADTAAEVKWVASLLDELGFTVKQPSMVWCDNLSAKALAENPVQHARSKHIEIDVHFIRDLILSK